MHARTHMTHTRTAYGPGTLTSCTRTSPLHKYSRDGGARARAHCSVRRRSDLRSAGPTMGPTALVLLRTSVLYSTYGHETAWTASYEPVRQAVLDTAVRIRSVGPTALVLRTYARTAVGSYVWP